MLKFLILLFTFIQIIFWDPVQAAQRMLPLSSSREPRLASEAFEDDDSNYGVKRSNQPKLQEITIPTKMFLPADRKDLIEKISDFSQLDEDGRIYIQGDLYLTHDTFIENIKYFIVELNKLSYTIPSISINLNITGKDLDSFNYYILGGFEEEEDDKGINARKKHGAEKLINLFQLFSQIKMEMFIDFRPFLSDMLNDSGYEISDLFKPFRTIPTISALRQRQVSGHSIKQMKKAQLQEIIFSDLSPIKSPVQICNLFSVLAHVYSLKALHVETISFYRYSDDRLKELGEIIAKIPQLKCLYFTGMDYNSFYIESTQFMRDEIAHTRMKIFFEALTPSSITTLGFKNEERFTPFSPPSELIENYFRHCTPMKTLKTLDLRYDQSYSQLRDPGAIIQLCDILRSLPIEKVIFNNTTFSQTHKDLITHLLGEKAVFLD